MLLPADLIVAMITLRGSWGAQRGWSGSMVVLSELLLYLMYQSFPLP